jgi:hypothetical protein
VAVYEGVRPRSIAIPRGERVPRTGRGAVAETPVLPRRRARAAVRAHRGPNRLALVLGAIVVAFMLAFFFLAQEVRVSATTYDISRLDAGLGQLDDAVVLPAR